jgi:hypothetical protein
MTTVSVATFPLISRNDSITAATYQSEAYCPIYSNCHTNLSELTASVQNTGPLTLLTLRTHQQIYSEASIHCFIGGPEKEQWIWGK